MAVLPGGINDLIQFCETHVAVWAAAPTTIGLTAAQVASLTSATSSARITFNDAQAAREASKAQTQLLAVSAGKMRDQAADLVRQIKAFAELQPTPGAIYAAAQIPEPLPPSPQPAPGIPENIKITLESTGAVTLSWSARYAAASSGAFYNVARRLPGQTGFIPVGGAAGTTTGSRTMSFTDYTIPTSAAGAGAQYVIQGRRGEELGEMSEAIVVQFGVDETGGGGLRGSYSVGGRTVALRAAACAPRPAHNCAPFTGPPDVPGGPVASGMPLPSAVYQALLNRRYLTSKIMPHLSIGAVALCVWMVLVTWSVMGGFLVMLLDLGRRMEADVSITWPTVGFAHYDDLIARLEADPMVQAAAPMIETFGLVSLPDNRVKGVSIRGVDARYARVSAYADSLWWRPLDQAMPKDAGQHDPRLNPNWGARAEQAMRAEPSPDFKPPEAGAIRDWKTLLDDGLSLTVKGEPAVVPGIELAGFAKRQREGWYRVEHSVGTRLDDGSMRWHSAFLPAEQITVNVLPLDKKGRNFTVRSRTLPVANEFRTGFFEADKNQVFMNLGQLQQMLNMDSGTLVTPKNSGADPYAVEGEGTGERPAQSFVPLKPAPARVTSVLVKARPGIESEQLRDRVDMIYAAFARAHFGEVPDSSTMIDGQGISTWERNQATFIGAVRKETALVLFLLMGISFVAVFLILAIFWSMVSEKTRDIGVLRAVGASRAGVAWLWLRYGLSIGLAGAVLGGVIAYLTITYINPIHTWLGEALGIVIWDPNVYYFSEIPSKVEPSKAAIVLAGALLFSVLGALIPALRAANMDPVRALRFE